MKKTENERQNHAFEVLGDLFTNLKIRTVEGEKKIVINGTFMVARDIYDEYIKLYKKEEENDDWCIQEIQKHKRYKVLSEKQIRQAIGFHKTYEYSKDSKMRPMS